MLALVDSILIIFAILDYSIVRAFGLQVTKILLTLGTDSSNSGSSTMIDMEARWHSGLSSAAGSEGPQFKP